MRSCATAVRVKAGTVLQKKVLWVVTFFFISPIYVLSKMNTLLLNQGKLIPPAMHNQAKNMHKNIFLLTVEEIKSKIQKFLFVVGHRYCQVPENHFCLNNRSIQ